MTAGFCTMPDTACRGGESCRHRRRRTVVHAAESKFIIFRPRPLLVCILHICFGTRGPDLTSPQTRTVASPYRRDAGFTLNIRQKGPVVIFYKFLLQNKTTLIK